MLVSIQAGNSDNKLTQKQWAELVVFLNAAIVKHQAARHFFGGSITWAEWQNVCWVIEIDEEYLEPLKHELRSVRSAYQQDSVCVLAGEAEFV